MVKVKEKAGWQTEVFVCLFVCIEEKCKSVQTEGKYVCMRSERTD